MHKIENLYFKNDIDCYKRTIEFFFSKISSYVPVPLRFSEEVVRKELFHWSIEKLHQPISVEYVSFKEVSR